MPLKFDDYTIEQAEDLDKAIAGGGAQFMKLEPGRNIVRFIPGTDGRDPFKTFYRHYINKPDGTSVSFACPAREANKACPVCEHANRLANSGSKADEKLAKTFWPSKTILANVIDRNDPEAGPKILRMGKKIVEQLTAIRKNEDAGGNYFHPVTGFDICIERSGTGKNDTTYQVMPSRKQTKLGPTDEVMQGWIDGVHDLEPFAEVKAFAVLQEMLSLDSGSQHQGHNDGSRKRLGEGDTDEFSDSEDGF